MIRRSHYTTDVYAGSATLHFILVARTLEVNTDSDYFLFFCFHSVFIGRNFNGVSNTFLVVFVSTCNVCDCYIEVYSISP
jgi:hypothetical protein